MAALNAYCEHILKAAYLVLWIFPKINRYAAFFTFHIQLY